jgi:tRNA(Arg) A34 adenosine deaminase TadA
MRRLLLVSQSCRLCTTVLTTLLCFSTIAAPFALQSYGENHYNDPTNPACSSVHAETNALKKLMPLPRQKKLKSGQLGNSKPCIHCILTLAKNLPEKGYSLCKVYYTNEYGDIVCSQFNELLHETNPHVSRFYMEKKFKLKSQI